MANIKVTIDYPIANGLPITFKSPADCSQVTGLTVQYTEGSTSKSKTFQFADAHGNNVGDIDLFASNVLVKVILDVDASKAYVQNADTNAYLESRFRNPNMLDNWYFSNPVDQRGGYVVEPNTLNPNIRVYMDKEFTNPSGGHPVSGWRKVTEFGTNANGEKYFVYVSNTVSYYGHAEDAIRGYLNADGIGTFGIDRWRVYNGVMEPCEDGVKYTPTTIGDGLSGFYQLMETKCFPDVGTKITASVLVDGVCYYGTITMPPTSTTAKVICTIPSLGYTLCLRRSGSTDAWFLSLQNYASNSVPCKLQAMKLELGSVQTLARQENGVWVLNDPPPDKGVELLKCMTSTASPSDTYTNKLVGTTQMKLLWENASLTSSFAAQTISLDLSGYDCVYIDFSNGMYYCANCLLPINSGEKYIMAHETSRKLLRSVNVGTTGVVFGNARVMSSGWADDNTVQLPWHIYGIKGVS